MSTLVHPRYIVDEQGRKVEVVLSVEEFDALMERMEAFADAKLLHEIAEASTDEDFIPWEQAKAEFFGIEQPN